MKPLTNLFVLSSCIAILCGCAAAMVPASNDPERKLGWATVLMDEQDRPLPAERLIREASKYIEHRTTKRAWLKAIENMESFSDPMQLRRWNCITAKKDFWTKQPPSIKG
jgi:hypothetical protein